MLTYKNRELNIDGIITSHDTILKLLTDFDCVIMGVIKLSNQSTKIINFIKENNYYKGRLLITKEDLPYLNNCKMYITLIDGDTSQTSNEIDIEFDITKVTSTVKAYASNEIVEIRKDLAQLSYKLDEVIAKAPSFIVTPTTPINSNFIKPGMIPIAIDETGRCIFQYPFIDHITEINGQKSVNSAIILTAKDIPIEQTDVDSAIKAHTEAIKELTSYMRTISTELKTTNAKVAEIEKALISHTDSSII